MADSINNLSEATVPKDIKESLLQASAVNDSRCQTCILREVCRGCPAGVYSEKTILLVMTLQTAHSDSAPSKAFLMVGALSFPGRSFRQ